MADKDHRTSGGGATANSDVAPLHERASRLLSKDYFVALGVARNASPDEIKRAFIEAAKIWHPDRAPPGQDALKQLFSKVITRLETARATLSEPASRARYLEGLSKPATIEDASNAEADLEFRKAEALLKKNDATQAERHLRRAIQLAPTNVEYQAVLVSLQAKPSATPDELHKLVTALDRLIARDAACKRAYFFRGQLKKRLNLTREAFADFSRVVDLDPNNIDAVREVRIYKMRQQNQEKKNDDAADKGAAEGVGGFFRRLFKR
jgi:curved DNA-binding protein CbpA